MLKCRSHAIFDPQTFFVHSKNICDYFKCLHLLMSHREMYVKSAQVRPIFVFHASIDVSKEHLMPKSAGTQSAHRLPLPAFCAALADKGVTACARCRPRRNAKNSTIMHTHTPQRLSPAHARQNSNAGSATYSQLLKHSRQPLLTALVTRMHIERNVTGGLSL